MSESGMPPTGAAAQTPGALADRDQRRASDPRASVFVSASAGSGKTKVLTDRVLRLLLAGSRADRLLCLTYTRAAAAEMANRISERLAVWATAPEPELADQLAWLTGDTPGPTTLRGARRLFAEVMDTPGGLKIETIHAFCQSLLRRFPLEAGVPPHFAVLDQRESAALLAEARNAVLGHARAGVEAGRNDPLARALGIVSARVDERRFDEVMGGAIAARGRLAAMLERLGGADGYAAALRARLGVAPDDTDGSIVSAACDAAAFDAAGLRAAVEALMGGTPKTDQKQGRKVAAWLEDPSARTAGFDAYSEVFLTQGGTIRDRLMTKGQAKAFPEAVTILQAEAARLAEVHDRRRAVALADASAALVRLTAAILAAYEREKAVRGLLDYDDLIARARALIGGDGTGGADGAAAWVLFKLDGGLEHVLVDEAQDSNRDQWAVIEALSGEFFAGLGAGAPADPTQSAHPRTVFAVGDVKQSIYSFQGAEPQAFAAERARFRDRVHAAHGHWDDVPMTVSFRSTEPILRAVDAVFAHDPARASVTLEPETAADEPIRHVAHRGGQAGLVELWPPVEPEDEDLPDPWKPPVEQRVVRLARTRLAGLVAERIDRMLDGRERLESADRPVRAGDILVLVRRRGPFVEDLVRTLKQSGVPVAGVDRMVLTEQLAVMDLIAAGRFCLLPEDDLTLATVLKGPLIGLTEEQLFEVAHGRGGDSLWTALNRWAGRDPACATALRILSGWRARADLLRPYEFFGHVLGPVPGEHERDGEALRDTGRKRLLTRLGRDAEDPIEEFLAQALAYETGHPPALEGFLHWVESAAVEVKRETEVGAADVVRVMTVHGAKGLQAPIVFLPDTLQVPRNAPVLLWDAEAGADELVLWSSHAKGEHPMAAAARAAARDRAMAEYHRLMYVAMTRAADRLYVCGWETRNESPKDCWYRLIDPALAPIAEVETDDAVGRVCASSEVWRLRAPQDAEPPRAPTARAAAAPEPMPDALWSPPPAERAPPRPLAPSRPAADSAPVQPPLAAAAGPEPAAGFRRGLLVHRLLQHLPEVSADARADAAERYLARPVHGLDAAARRSLAAEALAVLDDPEFAPAFGRNSRAEVPVVGVVGDQVVSGRVDRLAVLDDRVLVVDYKTNRPPPAAPEAVDPSYLAQMAAYRGLLRQIYPDLPVRCALLWTAAPRLMPLPDALLDRHAPWGITPSPGGGR